MKRSAICFVLASVLAACDEPTPGDLAVELNSPNVADGAIQFVVTATVDEAVRAVTPDCSGCRVFTRLVGDSEIRGIVTGALASGPFVSITVSDVGTPESYSFQIVGAATRDYETRGTTAGYSVTLRRAP